ncbi:MAG: DUF4442 domain-containing protein [Gemmatimonadota bacterium]|nr:DUF4442 domain-containing protein [Gemmatimonadota bacterium]
MADVPEARLLALWRRVSRLPLGTRIFDVLLARAVPYSGTVRPHVRVLEPGRVEILMRDRRRVRNHLRSVHAIALANVGELASGLAMTAALPSSVRGIVVRLEVEYFKKARGPILARSEARPPAEVTGPLDHAVTADLLDASGERVAQVTVHWRLAPRPAA